MERPLEIIFVYPQCSPERPTKFSCTRHLGASYLIAFLRQRGVRAETYIEQRRLTLQQLAAGIIARQPRRVGCTCYDTNYYFITLLARELRRQAPDLPILLGGATATFSDELIMRSNPAITLCCRGEAEWMVGELMQRDVTFGRCEGIAGVTYRADGELRRTPRGPVDDDDTANSLDRFPSPYLTGVVPPLGQAGLLTSRGCPFNCTYCSRSALARHTIRYHSPERVVSEMEMIYRERQKEGIAPTYGKVQIFDECFSMDLARAKEICRGLLDRGIRLPLSATTRADRVDAELLSLLAACGCKLVHYGVESAVPEVLRTIRKVSADARDSSLTREREYLERVRESVALTRQAGIDVSVSLIMGLPGSTPAGDRAGIEYMAGLQPAQYGHCYLQIYPGTELFTTHRQFGITVEPSETVLPYRTIPAYDPGTVPEHERSAARHVLRPRQWADVVRVLTGRYHDAPGSCPELLFVGGELTAASLDWLHSFVMPAPLLLMARPGIDQATARQQIGRLVAADLPVVALHYLTADALATMPVASAGCRLPLTSYQLVVATAIVEPRVREFTARGQLRLGDAASGLESLQVYDADESYGFMAIDSTGAMARLAALAGPEGVTLSRPLASGGGGCLDACRWHTRECPALALRRLLIDAAGNLYPCRHGERIGRVGEPLALLRERLHNRYREQVRRRGCSDCAAQTRCSRCLFPQPVNEAGFCRLMRDAAERFAALRLPVWAAGKIAELRVRDARAGWWPQVRRATVLPDLGAIVFDTGDEKIVRKVAFPRYAQRAPDPGSRQ